MSSFCTDNKPPHTDISKSLSSKPSSSSEVSSGSTANACRSSKSYSGFFARYIQRSASIANEASSVSCACIRSSTSSYMFSSPSVKAAFTLLKVIKRVSDSIYSQARRKISWALLTMLPMMLPRRLGSFSKWGFKNFHFSKCYTKYFVISSSLACICNLVALCNSLSMLGR